VPRLPKLVFRKRKGSHILAGRHSDIIHESDSNVHPFRRKQMQIVTDESLEVRLRRVKKNRKRAQLLNELRKNAWKYSRAKNILDTQNILLAYITDKFGFKKGVILAIGPGQIGWSLVNKNDYHYETLGIEQIPKLANFIQNPTRNGQDEVTADEALSALVDDTAFKAFIEAGGFIQVPDFDRASGIVQAYDRALLYQATKPDSGLTFDDVPLPHDKDLRGAIMYMIDRSHRYFRDKPHALQTS